MIDVKPIRKKKCRVCKKTFQPRSSLQVCCGINCAIEHAQSKRKAKERKEYREAKERIKSRGDWIKDVQERAFNPYIRARDVNEPCISCGRFDNEIPDSPFGKWDCGHYLSVGSHPELRFHPDNAHKQCKSCNGGSGKYAKKNHTVAKEYRINLIAKIGLERVEFLEGPHDPKKYTIDDLKAIKAEYKQKQKDLSKSRPE